MTRDPVATARELQTLVREAADEAERECRLPAHVAEAGLYRVGAPRTQGGGEHDPMTQIAVIEAIAEADGSAAWNLMVGIESFGLLTLGFRNNRELFADPLTVLCGSTAALGVAEVVDGGYRLTGRWQFASGCHNSHWFYGLSVVHENGAPKADEPPRFMLVPRAEFEIVENWKVGGLRGSGSHDVQVESVFVPEARVATFMAPGSEIAEDAPIVRFPRGSRLAYNKVGIGLGIARAAIDDFVEIATGKIPRFSSSTLRERPLAQRAVAAAEARLRGARAFVMEAVGEVWDEVVAGKEPSARQRALLQIACSDAARASAEAVDLVAEAAGTTANDLESPLERRARDVRVVRQHMTVAPHHLEDAGRVLLGLSPEGLMLSLV